MRQQLHTQLRRVSTKHTQGTGEYALPLLLLPEEKASNLLLLLLLLLFQFSLFASLRGLLLLHVVCFFASALPP